MEFVFPPDISLQCCRYYLAVYHETGRRVPLHALSIIDEYIIGPLPGTPYEAASSSSPSSTASDDEPAD